MTTATFHRILNSIERAPVLRRFGARGRRAAVAAAAITLLGAGALGASMTALSWNNASGGSMGLPGNWSPAQVPTAADDITFNLGGTYTVTSGVITNDTRSHTYRSGSVTLSQTGTHTVTNGVTVGDLAGDNATFTLTTGTLSSATAVVVGDAGTATGTLNVNDSDADLVTTTTAGDLTIGNSGAGTMNLTNGGLARVSDRFVAGNILTSSAGVTVSGENGATRSTLEVNGATSTHAIGSAGDATMNVSNGALADFDGTVNVAQTGNSTSTLTLSGAGLFPATLVTSGDFNIARNTTALTAGGTGAVNVNSGGLLNVGGTLTIGGDPDGGTALLHIGADAAAVATTLDLDDQSELDFDGGTITIDGGTLDNADPDGLSLGAPGNPTLILDNGAAVVLPGINSGEPLRVGGIVTGFSDSARVDIRGGSSLTVPIGMKVVLAKDGDETDWGSIDVQDAGSSLDIASTFVIGESGYGQAQVFANANLAANVVIIAQQPASIGHLGMFGEATATIGRLFVGGANAGTGGDGEAFIADGSVCTVTDTGIAVKVWEDGFLDVSNAQVNVAGAIEMLGSAHVHGTGTLAAREANVAASGRVEVENASLTLSDTLTIAGEGIVKWGTIQADRIIVDGELHGNGVVSGDVAVISTGASIRADGGPLTLGSAASTEGFLVSSGTLEVTDEIVTLLDTDWAGLGANTTIAGGTLIAPNGIGLGTATATLTGHGVIDADCYLLGSITASDTGLVFMGQVESPGQRINGTSVRFADGSSFEGFGVIATDVKSDPNSTITASGHIELGDSTLEFPSLSDIDIGGALFVGSDSVTIYTILGAQLGRSTTLGGGDLRSLSGLALSDQDTLIGFGSVTTRGIGMTDQAVVAASGPLTIGSPLFFEAGVTGGRLEVGSHAVELVAGTTVSLGASTRLGVGGTLTSDQPITLEGSSGILAGPGSVATPAFTNMGVIAPGDTLGNGPLTINATYVQQPTGMLAITIAGSGSLAKQSGAPGVSASQRWNRMTVAGDVTLGGTLRVELAPDASLTAGDTLTILDCTMREGFFSTVWFVNPFVDNSIDVAYTNTKVMLIVNETTGVDLPPTGNPSDGSGEGDAVGGGAAPAQFALRLASRNPFNAADGAAFEYDIPRGGAPVSITVFDASGRSVANLVSGVRAAGSYAERWTSADLRALPSGVYFLRMDAGAFGETKKLVMMR